MAENNAENKWGAVIVPIVVAILGLIGVIASSDWFAERMIPPTPTSAPIATKTVASAPTRETTATSLPPTATEVLLTATFTPIPLPLEEIFPQVGEGEIFVFVNNPAIFSGEIVRDECVHSGIYGLKLIYDIKNSGSGGWGVQWEDTFAKTVDLSSYSTLLFWVKSGSGMERFQIGIKDGLEREQKIESTDLIILTKDWQQVRVPLSRFRDVNLGLVNNINFGFNATHSNGVLCIDDIVLE